MDKSKIFIASSGRTLLLAEKLRDELATDFCQATLWSEEGRLQPGSTIIEMLQDAARQYDFAVILLAKDDVLISGDHRAVKARDNCVFEAGLFMSAIGRARCFLMTSVAFGDLPSDLGGIISIPFDEPTNLQDRKACGEAVAKAAVQLKDVVQRDGPSLSHNSLPLLSVDEVFRRERSVSEGGDLSGGNVVVCETQPWAEISRAVTVRSNIDNGTSYQYFLFFSDDTIEKIAQALQVIAWAGVANPTSQSDFKTRIETIRNEKDRVCKDMLDICRTGRLRISLVPEEQSFYFRVHNASNPAQARYYARYGKDSFVLWTEGPEATTLWRSLPRWLEDDRDDRIFIPLKYPQLNEDERTKLRSSVKRSLSRYFPGIEDDITQMFLGHDY